MRGQTAVDVAVIGGGITGAFAARFLSMAGVATVLIDPDGIGAHASGRNPGGLNPLHGPGIPGPMSAFALEAFHLHLDLQDAIRVRPEPVVRVRIAMEPDDVAELEAAASLHQATPGFSAAWLQPAGLRALDARISPDAIAGLRTEGNMRLADPRAYARAVADAAVRHGARVIAARATGLAGSGRRVDRVVFADGTSLPCGGVVIANGPWAGEAAAWLDEPVPVMPVKGDLLYVEATPPVAFDFTWRDAAVYGASTLACLGGTTEHAGFDETPAAAARASILQRVGRFFPGLSGAPIVRQTAGLRPVTPDGLPIVGRSCSRDNVWLALGGGAKGMLYGPGIARAVADLIVDGRTRLSISPCSPLRFLPESSRAAHAGEVR